MLVAGKKEAARYLSGHVSATSCGTPDLAQQTLEWDPGTQSWTYARHLLPPHYASAPDPPKNLFSLLPPPPPPPAMAPISVNIKHAGKTHAVQLDTALPPAAFKDAIYQVTGVPPERMKVMIKGGVLKVRDRPTWMRG